MFCYWTTAEPIAYKDCPGDNLGHATAVTLSPCNQQPCTFKHGDKPCTLKHGDKVTVTITFNAANDTSILHSKVFGIVADIPVPFPLPNQDGCRDSGINCPITKGQTYTYTSSFDVLPTYPQITLVVMWKLEGATGNFVCFTFPMSISDSGAVVG
ncbi:dnaJ subfamily C member 13 [Biomphalaria pfeifferi]|uniref:DnaJ subfamily C member 13 n=1 Tax=Biomphalaria pfeifferi TaxID=112525 RepID=A0AAD8F9Q1_BIOPF|nr:dnaJ subfamily C member 13 [Biomphalaria pfeifferi]